MSDNLQAHHRQTSNVSNLATIGVTMSNELQHSEDILFVKTVTIDRMTMDLFHYWLEHDWNRIAEGAFPSSTQPPIVINSIKTNDNEQYFRSYTLLWKENRNIEDYSFANIVWAQIRTDTVRVEFTKIGRLSVNLAEWLKYRFGVDEPTEDAPTISNKPPKELTPTETKVADYLAEKLSYEQIAVRLGRKSLAAAKKHAQNIARKWNTRQVVEVLWDEAIKRGYGTPH
jgi:DNA-binding CsgD family transcriptional regulator